MTRSVKLQKIAQVIGFVGMNENMTIFNTYVFLFFYFDFIVCKKKYLLHKTGFHPGWQKAHA